MPRQPVPPAATIAVEYVPLDELLKWPTNAKEHDLSAIAASIIRFGMRDPIGANRRNHYIEEGHGRRDTLVALKRQGRPVPKFVVPDESGNWLVPVLFYDDDEITQRAYALAHNKTQELGGGYDDVKLLEELEAQANHGLLPGTGWDGDDVDALRRKVSGDPSGAEPQQMNATFQILVTCTDEQNQLELIERFSGEGLTVRALVS
jgi:hypothetical protein